jgi:hypothetical protein
MLERLLEHSQEVIHGPVQPPHEKQPQREAMSHQRDTGVASKPAGKPHGTCTSKGPCAHAA